ncbi:MAG: hypothetical protein AABY97_08090 [Chloroflexota bacterium]
MGAQFIGESDSLAAQRNERRASLAARLCGFAFILTMPLTLLIAEAGRVSFNPTSLSRVLSRIAFETEALPMSLAWLTQTFPEGNLAYGDAQLFPETPALFRLVLLFEAEVWKVVLQELLPSDALAGWIEDTAQGLDLWLDGKGGLSQVSYDLTQVKAQALSSHGLRAARIAFEVLPPCTPVQVLPGLGDASAVPLDAEFLRLPCALPSLWADDQFFAYAGTIPELVGTIRDSFTLIEALNPGEDPSIDMLLESARGVLRWARALTRLAPLLPAALLAAILVLQVRTWTELAGWWSPWLGAGGLIAMAVALARLEMLRLALRALPEGQELIGEALFHAGSAVASEMAWPLLVRGATALLLGLALRAYAASAKRRGDALERANTALAAEST